MGKGGRFYSDAVTDLRHRNHAPAAVFRGAFNRNELSRPEPVNHALDRVGVEIDQPAELILRACADFDQLG